MNPNCFNGLLSKENDIKNLFKQYQFRTQSNGFKFV